MVEASDFGVGDFRGDGFGGANRFRRVHENFVVFVVNEIFGAAEISNFDIELLIN